jgi:pimeloyl-ACP methyl ester carboxylesterase
VVGTTLKHRFAWIIVSLVGIAFLGLSSLAALEQIRRSNASREYPARGRIIDVDGHRLQVECQGNGTPTVVLEAGLDTLGALSWSEVQSPIAQWTRVCSYSRAGILWSGNASGVFGATRAARDLHQLLELVGERPPFVLVGHSLGAAYALIFTRLYPTEVAGLVLVDPSHPDQIERFNQAFNESAPPPIPWKLRIAPLLAWTGCPRTLRALAAPKEAPAKVAATANAYVDTSAPALLQEMQNLSSILRDAGQMRALGDRPLVVLTAARRPSADETKELGWTANQTDLFYAAINALHADEASWSSRGRHELVSDSDHYIQFERPDLVIGAVREVVDGIRQNVRQESPL